MKHLERLKIVAWAVKNEWVDKNPFIGFQLKFKRRERDFLQANELAAIACHVFPLKEDLFQKMQVSLIQENLSVFALDFDEWFGSLRSQKSLQKQ